jgi:hypothetical protein
MVDEMHGAMTIGAWQINRLTGAEPIENILTLACRFARDQATIKANDGVQN